MLALDSSIGCIEASEPDVLDLFKSSPVITSKAGGSKTERVEGFVCAIRRKTRVNVYVALVADDKRIFVYTTSKPDTEETYGTTLQEALEFIRSMGFAPERVNLSYSAAMREVVVRNTKILRPPGSRVTAFLRHGVANAPTPAVAQGTAAHKGAPATATPPPSPRVAPALSLAVPSPIDELPADLLNDTSELAPHPSLPSLINVSVAPSLAPSAPSAPSVASVASSIVSSIASPVVPSVASAPASSVAPLAAAVAATVVAEPMVPARGSDANNGGGENRAGSDEVALLEAMVKRLTEEKKALHTQAAKEVTALQEKLARTLAEAQQERERFEAEQAARHEEQELRTKAEAEALRSLNEQLTALSTERDAHSAKIQELCALRRQDAAELAAATQGGLRLASEQQELVLRLEELEATARHSAELQLELAELTRQHGEASRREREQTCESAAREEALTGARQEIASLTAQCDQARQEVDSLTAQRDQARQEVDSLTAQRDQARQEVASLTAQRDEARQSADKVVAAQDALVAAREELQAEMAEIAAHRDAASQRVRDLEQERATDAAQLKELRAEMAAQRKKLAKLATQPEAAQLAAPDLEVTGSANPAHLADLEALRAEVTAGNKEIATLSAQLEAARLDSRGLERKGAATGAELGALRAEQQTWRQQAAELTAQLVAARLGVRGLEKERGSLKDALESLRAEKETLQAEAAKRPAQSEAAQLQARKPRRDQHADVAGSGAEKIPAAEVEAPREQESQSWLGRNWYGEESESTGFEGGTIEPALESVAPPLAAQVASPAPATLPDHGAENSAELVANIPDWAPDDSSEWQAGAQTNEPAPESKKQESLPLFSDEDDFFGSDDGAEASLVQFLLKRGLTAIQLPSPDAILELHQSINVAYLSPDGKGQESCQGYICCLGNAGARQVVAAIHGAKSGRTWVYLPEAQPGDDLAYANTMRGAIRFAEDVGFMMEPVDLRGGRRQKSEKVLRCPVLNCTGQK